MPTSYKPSGYTSVAPYLIVPSAAQTIQFLVAALGAEEIRRFPSASGGVMHAEVRIDDTVVMLADAAPDWPPGNAQVHVYVPDVDAAYARALAAGATGLQEPVQKDDDDKRGGVRDAGGITWWIASKLG